MTKRPRKASTRMTSIGVAVLAVGAVAVVGYAIEGSGGSHVADAGTAPVASGAATAGIDGLTNVNSNKPLAAWIGDTWISGIDGGGISEGIAAQASRALGLDWQVDSQPQTGWATGGLAGVQGLNTPFPDRVPSVVAQKPRLVVIAGGSNDAVRSASPTAVTKGVLDTVTGLRHGLPSGAQIVIVGPTWPSLPVPPQVLATEATVKAEADALKVPFIDPLAGKWITPQNVGEYEKNGFLTQAGNTALAQRFTSDLKALGVTVTSS